LAGDNGLSYSMNLKFGDFTEDFREVKANCPLPRRASALPVRFIGGTMKHIKIILIIISLKFLINCDSATKSEDTVCSLITDYMKLSCDCDYLDTLRIVDIDFTFKYHFEGSGGQLIKYFYYLRDIRTEFGMGTGWIMSDRAIRPVGGKIRYYTESDILDTLRYSDLFDISKQDTFYKEFKFTLKGFFSDSGFSNVKDTLDKKSFEYVYIDTILIIN
jgi:hypothetical protein